MLPTLQFVLLILLQDVFNDNDFSGCDKKYVDF